VLHRGVDHHHEGLNMSDEKAEMLVAERIVERWEVDTCNKIERGRAVLVSEIAEALSIAAYDGTVLNLATE
jgi:hypothetical protein